MVKSFLPATALAILSTSSQAPAQIPAPKKTETLQTQQHTMRYEEFGSPTAPATIILLHGASGPDFPPYRPEAEFFATQGYYVLLPHLFDVSSGNTPSDANYQAWVNAVADLIAAQRSLPGNGPRKIGLNSDGPRLRVCGQARKKKCQRSSKRMPVIVNVRGDSSAG